MADSIKLTVTNSTGSWVQRALGGSISDAWYAMQVYIPSATETDWNPASFTSPILLQVSNSGVAKDFIYLYDNDADGHYDKLTGPDFFPDPTVAPPADGWHKLELHHSIAGTASEAELYWDDVSLQTNFDWREESLTEALFGAIQQNFGAPTSGIIYIARIKIGTTRGANDIFSFDASAAVDLSDFTVTGTAVLDTAPTSPPIWSGSGGGGGGDTTPPVLLDSYISGSTVVLVYNETLTTNAPDISQFTVTINGAPYAITDVEASGENVIITLASAPPAGAVADISYTPA